MCFNYKVSLFTFLLGTLFSFLLIKYGNKKYTSENTVTGIFLCFISLIQFMDFLFWIDLKNKLGINKITTIVGPILNVGQPIILYLIKYFYYKPNIFVLTNFNLPVALINLLYFIYLIIFYYNFISSTKLITTVEDGHLKWPWLKHANSTFYLILFAINIFYLVDFKYSSLLFLITYLFFFLSVKYFYYRAGELWCFFGAFIPLFMFLSSFLIL
jgi:hypothetical protein